MSFQTNSITVLLKTLERVDCIITSLLGIFLISLLNSEFDFKTNKYHATYFLQSTQQAPAEQDFFLDS